MATPDVIDAGRRRAETRMTSTCSVRRPTGTTVVDGVETDAYTTDVYFGPFRLAGPNAAAGSRTKTTGGVEYEVAARVAHFPALTPGLRDGDVLEVTDGENAGLFFRLIEVDAADQQTALRVPVESVSKPGGWV